MKYLSYLIAILFIAAVAACGSLEKEIDLNLPEYEPQYVVECYLEPGQPFSLLLTRSAPYFEPFPSDLEGFVETLLVDSAEVLINYQGKTHLLTNGLVLNPFTK